MFSDIVRGIIQTIFRDKILMGLVIVGVIAIVSAGAAKDDKKADEPQANGPQATAPEPGQPQAQAQAQAQAQTPVQGQAAGAAPTQDAKLAAEFVQWWLSGAMDYQAATCQKNHVEAFKWMNPESIDIFKANFWTPEMEQAFATGTLIAQFQVSSVEAKAINPDGSVVVGVDGSLVMQMGGPPTTQRVLTDYLVKKENGSMRIAAIHNKTIAPFSTIPTY